MKNFFINLGMFLLDWNKWREAKTLKIAIRRCKLDSLTNTCRYYMLKGTPERCRLFPERYYYYGDTGYVWLTSNEITWYFGHKKSWLFYFKQSTAVIERGKIINYDEYQRVIGVKRA